ncbi:MAG TPA: hypothetical protein VKF36_01320 [Syntrophorhabdales bacterium]|nr:hypothetical protein [Syntrophorhabdales bacterium]
MKAFRFMGCSTSVMILLPFLLVLSTLCFWPSQGYSQEPQPSAEEVTPDKWPRTANLGGVKYTIYQPQLDTWDGYQFEAHAAVSVLPASAKEPLFGVINTTAVTQVDRVSRAVRFYNVKIVKTIFPSAPDKESQFQAGFQTMLSGIPFHTSLDRLQEALAVEGAETKARAIPVKNEPPRFIFSQTAAALIHIDGQPVWRTVQGTRIVRVLNTRALILGDTSGKVYLHLFDGFLQAPSLSGPWAKATTLPANAGKIAQELSKQRVVDLMEGPPDDTTKKKPSLRNGFPQIIVTTTPTELILTQGPPDWGKIEGTMLLYVQNTTGNIFKDLNDQQTYVLVTGRWFRAPDFGGPWQYVDGKDLPVEFVNIPDDSPKENVKASVPGTPQAQAAVIASEIPQTARVDRTKAKFTPQISGNPDLRPIEGTQLSYVFNSPMPIIVVSPTQWYGVQSGVWFTASSAQGPWTVATSVPSVIYSIPPSSPVYYATYVHVYDATPEYVTVGYTPGYLGTVVTPDGVVVYGTGYDYVPYVGSTVWYGWPVTYGYAANPTWTPWTGWAIGFGMGWALGAATSNTYCYAPAPYWGAMPYSPYHGYAYGAYGGVAAWGPRGWAATSGDVYQKWGPTTAVSRTSAGYNAWTGNAWSDKVGTSYNSVTGRVSAGQKASVSNVYTGNYAYGQRGATYNPNTGVAAKGGTVTYGNAYTGQQDTAKYGKVSGPGGQSAEVAKTGTTSYYAGRDGTVYKNTGNGWESNSGSGWNSVPKPTEAESTRPNAAATERPSAAPSVAPKTITITNQSLGLNASGLDAQQQARQQGDQRSAASSWGSKSWGGGFSGQPGASASTAGTRAEGASGSPGGDRGDSSSFGSWGGSNGSSGGGNRDSSSFGSWGGSQGSSGGGDRGDSSSFGSWGGGRFGESGGGGRR